MSVSLASGVTASAGYSPPTWPTASTANSLATVQGIIAANGAYNSYLPNEYVVAASSVKSHVMTATAAGDNTSSLLLDTVNIPPNVIGPDGWLELEVTWGCNSSANVKKLVPVNWTTNAVGLDQQTTNVSSTFKMILHNRNHLHSQILPSASPASGSQGSTTGVQTLSQFMDSGENTLGLWGVTTSATSGDTIWIERWTLKAFNPPVYSTKRLMYGTPMFHGVNGHYDDSASIAQHISDMKVMGFKTLRMAYVFGTSLTTLISYAQAIQAENAANHTGLQMICCIAYPLTDGGGNPLWANEAAAYSFAYSTAVTVVSALAPLGVLIYEGGNEMEFFATGFINGGAMGGFANDFNNALVPFFRGIQRGYVDGVHATSPVAIAGSQAYTQCSIALADMMWNGTQPDGSTGHPVVRWDATIWHNYEDYGSMLGVPRGFAAGTCNLLEHLNRSYGGVPIIITEWNGKSGDTDAQRAWWATRFMSELWNNRYKYNIAGICVYELYGGSPWTVMASAGVPLSTFGTTIQSFIAANPDTGT